MRMLVSRIVIATLIFAVVVAALAFVFAPNPPAVEVHRVSRGPLEVTVGDEGRTRVKDLFVVSAPIAGQMRRVEIEVGDPVVADETVLTYIEALRPRFFDLREITEHRALVASAKAERDLAVADIERARAELSFAELELKRNKELVDKRAVSSRTLESAELDIRVKQAQLAVARSRAAAKEAQVQVAEAALLQAPPEPAEQAEPESRQSPRTAPGKALDTPPAGPVVAPVTGRLLRRIRESESIVEAGEPLFEVGDPSLIEIVVDLVSQDAVKVAVGAAARIDGWGGEQPLNGVVRRVEPYGFTEVSALGIEEQRVDLILDLTDPQAAFARLGHGYRVHAEIRIWYGEAVLRVPIGALFRDRNRWAVYLVLPNGTVALSHLDIGHRNDRFAEVTGGLEPGALVVLHPSDRIQHGAPVLVQGASAQ
jgi:HlyD family secretion protein